MNKSNIDFSLELDTLIPLVKKIGIDILKIYDTDFSHEMKEDNSPVTKADLLSNKMLIEGLSKFGYDMISEESENDILTAGRTWVIDPLDGTKNFIRKTGEFAIMVGLIENYEPVFGLVYSPVLDKLYYGVKGHGSYLIEGGKKTRLHVNEIDDLKKARMVVGRSNKVEKEIVEIGGIRSHINLGSIGLKLGFIAEGKAEIFFFNKDSFGIWDLIGPMVILEGAGGKVFDNNGNDFNFHGLKEYKLKNGFVATNKGCYDKMKKIVKEL